MKLANKQLGQSSNGTLSNERNHAGMNNHSSVGVNRWIGAIAAFLILASLGPVQAAILTDLYDSFTGTGAITNHTPNVSLSGGGWMIPGYNPGSPYTDINGSNQAKLQNDVAFKISIASAGSYVKPTKFTISADLNLNGSDPATNSGSAYIPNGIAFGFFDNITNLNEGRSPLGIQYSPDGRLIVIDGLGNNATPGGENVNALDYSTGLFANSGLHNVAFTVDTTSGSISAVQFDGSAVGFATDLGTATAGYFTNARTDLAGIYGHTGDSGIMDNFLITSVPEPSTFALLGLGGWLVRRQMRARRA